MSDDPGAEIYRETPGGPELLRWFGRVPSFHDGEVLELSLKRAGRSVLRVHGWNMTHDAASDTFGLEKHAVVTFGIEGIMDLQLYGFSHQNVLGRLVLRRAPDRPEARGHLSMKPLPEDIEIELEPCFGMSGYLRARRVEISFRPGDPEAGE